jgi:dihydrofolate reductase
MNFSLIAACDKEMGIGKAGTLPWRLPGELAYFHRVTSEVADSQKRNAVIMGRKTWESIPPSRRPLAGRLNCVITRDASYQVPEGVMKFGSLEECLDFLEEHPHQTSPLLGGGPNEVSSRERGERKGGVSTIEHAFIIGGGELFRQAITMEECESMYLTELEGTFGCDTFFPPLPPEFKVINKSNEQTENGIRYHFVTYAK